MRALLLLALPSCMFTQTWGYGSRATPEVNGTGDLAVWTSVVNASVADWSYYLGHDCEFPFRINAIGDRNDDHPITYVSEEHWNYGDDVIGQEWFGGIVIRVEADPWHMKPTIMHELGHAFGLDHSSDPSSLMYYASAASEPTPDDIRSARFALDCAISDPPHIVFEPKL